MSNAEVESGLKIGLHFKNEVSPKQWVKTALQVRTQYAASMLRGETVADVDAKLIDHEVETRTGMQLERIPNLQMFDPDKKLPAGTPLRISLPDTADRQIIEEVTDLYRPKK